MDESLRLLGVFAHPDDESFRCGGTLALLSRCGVRVQTLTVTRGQAGACGNPPLCSPQELPVVREKELNCACTALGIAPPRLLDYPDGRLPEVDPEQIIAEILAVVHELNPQVILTYGPEGVSGHPDHIAIGQFAHEAFRRAGDVSALYALAVPQSIASALGMSRIRPVPDEFISLCVDVSAAWEAKLAAVRCHRTQSGESPILKAPPEQQRLFLGWEHFRRLARRGGNDFLEEVVGKWEKTH